MLKLASWNVNSLKVRLNQVLEWLKSSQTHVLAVQETKVQDQNFPETAFRDQGYHVVYSGQKTYNGMAVISRYPLEDVVLEVPFLDDPQRRFIALTVAGIRLLNVYVPNGADRTSDKYQYKLHWMHKMTEFVQEQLRRYPKMVILGDFNIAPEDRDVHDPAEWEGSVLVSPAERKAFFELLELGLHDSYRNFLREEQQYSWWDYRAAAFRRNRGLRIDHVLLSDELNGLCKQAQIDKEPRKAECPSDHAPVWVELAEIS